MTLRLRVRLGLIAGLLAGLVVLGLSGCEAERPLVAADRNVVRIFAQPVDNPEGVYAGSGFLVAPGYAVTNQHVIGNANTVIAIVSETNEPKIHRAKVLWSSSDHDLAVLHIETLNRSGLPLNLANPERAKGERIWAMGFPGLADVFALSLLTNPSRTDDRLNRLLTESTVSSGVVGRVIQRPWLDGTIDLTIIQHDATLHGGNSGGPLLNSCGQVLGVNTERAVPVLDLARGQIHPGEGLAFALHASELALVLDSLGLRYRTSYQSCNPLSGTLARVISSGVLLALMALTIWWILRRRASAGPDHIAGAGIVVRTGQNVNLDKRTLREHSGLLSASGPDFKTKTRWHIVWFSSETQGTWPTNAACFASESGCVLGRSDTVADLVIDDGSVSKRHCALRRLSGYWEIMDLNSANGTLVGGHPIPPFVWQALPDNEPWHLGEVSLMVRLADPAQGK